MSLPINENTQPEVTQPEPNPSLEPAQNAQTAVANPVETLPKSEGLGETSNKQAIQNNEVESKVTEHISQPKEEENKQNPEATQEKALGNSTSQENTEVKEDGEGEEDTKPKRQYRKRGAKFDDFERYNDTGSYIPATSRSGRAIKKATVFQAAESTPTKRSKPTNNTPAAILIRKRGRKPKNAAVPGQDQSEAPKAPGGKRKAGRPKKSGQNATAEPYQAQSETQSVPSATAENITIPAVLDNQNIPQQDSSTSQLTSNTLPQSVPQTFPNSILGINQNEPVNNSLPAHPQLHFNQFQQPYPIEQTLPNLSSNLPSANGIQQQIFNAGAHHAFNSVPIDQQIISNSVANPPPSAQNQNTFAAPTKLTTEATSANTTSFN